VITGAAGYNAGFLTLAAIALAALLVFFYGVPETKPSPEPLSPEEHGQGQEWNVLRVRESYSPPPFGVEAALSQSFQILPYLETHEAKNHNNL